MKKQFASSLVLCACVALGSAGCSTSDNGSSAGASMGGGSSTQSLELFSWWVAPGEAEALQALVDTYKTDYPGARVSRYTNISADSWQTVLNDQIDQSPWDVVQMAGADLPKFTADHPGALAELDSFYDEASIKASVIPDILKSVTVNGHAYGIVTGVHRNNAFLYNQAIFKSRKLAPPTTAAEFLTVCKKLKAAGITPVATTFQTWALRIMFDEILAGTLGATTFDDFLNGKKAATDPDVKAGITVAVDTFSTVLNDYVDRDASMAADYGWSNAVEALHNGAAAMVMHGDWAKGYLVQLGWDPGVDFGVSGPPGASDLFIYGADTFALPTVAPHQVLGDDFLTVVASAQGQVNFNKYKGATPMRTDVRDQLDAPGQANLDDLVNAKVLTASHANAAWDDAIGAFSKDGDKAALLNVYLTAQP